MCENWWAGWSSWLLPVGPGASWLRATGFSGFLSRRGGGRWLGGRFTGGRGLRAWVSGAGRRVGLQGRPAIVATGASVDTFISATDLHPSSPGKRSTLSRFLGNFWSI